MSEDHREREGNDSETPPPEKTPVEASSPEEPSARPVVKSDPVAALEARLETLQKERDELNDRYLRAVADFDNARKRLRAEQALHLQFANEKLIIELLPVLDNLERALESASTQNVALRSGVELTARMFADVLARLGVAPIRAEGQPFDPVRHEAVGEVETDEQEEGTVVEEVQRGYVLHDRVIRPSRVRVATRSKTTAVSRPSPDPSPPHRGGDPKDAAQGAE